MDYGLLLEYLRNKKRKEKNVVNINFRQHQMGFIANIMKINLIGISIKIRICKFLFVYPHIFLYTGFDNFA
jgi:hypothetical protein